MGRKTKHDDEMRSRYDFSGGERGKYATRYAEGTSVVVLAPDSAAVFTDSVAVNETFYTFVPTSPKSFRTEVAPKKPHG